MNGVLALQIASTWITRRLVTLLSPQSTETITLYDPLGLTLRERTNVQDDLWRATLFRLAFEKDPERFCDRVESIALGPEDMDWRVADKTFKVLHTLVYFGPGLLSDLAGAKPAKQQGQGWGQWLLGTGSGTGSLLKITERFPALEALLWFGGKGDEGELDPWTLDSELLATLQRLRVSPMKLKYHVHGWTGDKLSHRLQILDVVPNLTHLSFTPALAASGSNQGGKTKERLVISHPRLRYLDASKPQPRPAMEREPFWEWTLDISSSPLITELRTSFNRIVLPPPSPSTPKLKKLALKWDRPLSSNLGKDTIAPFPTALEVLELTWTLELEVKMWVTETGEQLGAYYGGLEGRCMEDETPTWGIATMKESQWVKRLYYHLGAGELPQETVTDWHFIASSGR